MSRHSGGGVGDAEAPGALPMVNFDQSAAKLVAEINFYFRGWMRTILNFSDRDLFLFFLGSPEAIVRFFQSK